MEGERLGPYLIGRELGSGGMGTVYAATAVDRTPGLAAGTVIALKIVHPHLLRTPGFFKRFMREATLGQSIAHENVVRTLECDAIDDTHFLVMEYVEGQTLAELQRELQCVPEELCRHVAREICKGLVAIHAAGIVHRDLKPENVLITADHVVKIMDLGVARLVDEAIRLSQSGAFVGSVEYAAPEQFEGGDVDGRTDLHALGLLLYELAGGAHPFRGGGFHDVMRRVCADAPRRLGDVNPQLSAFFEETVHTLLVKDPRGRFASAPQLLRVFEDGENSPWWHERARRMEAATDRPLRRICVPRETLVYGREKELALLRKCFARASGGDGQVVLIEGEPGIGKSRLVDELIDRLRSDGHDVNFLFGSYPPSGAATSAGAFSAAYREHFGEAGSAAYLGRTPVLVPAFDALLNGEGAPTGVQVLTKDSLQTCFVNATRALAAERVTVVLIDDLHFAPDEGRALFISLAMAVPGERVLLIGTARHGVSDEWVSSLTRFEQTTPIALDRLGPKDLVRLLAESLGSTHLAEELAGRIALKSDGNPFFAFEIIRGLREGQFITQANDGEWVSTAIIREIAIPSSVRDLVNARVASLSDDDRALLDVAACCGYAFDPCLVGDVLGIARVPVLRGFGRLERVHRLVRASGRHYVFDHHQAQEALYSAIHERLREEYHAAIADALAEQVVTVDPDPLRVEGVLAVQLCEHYLKGARGEQAVRYLPAAQASLMEGYLHAQAVELTERVLAVPRLLVGVERAHALLLIGDVRGPLANLGWRARQEACAREAERLAEDAGDADLLGRAAIALGGCLVQTDQFAGAETVYGRLIDLAVTKGDREIEASASGGLGGVCLNQGRLTEAQEHLERQLLLSRAAGDRGGESHAMGNLGSVFQAQGLLEDAREMLECDLKLSRAIGDRSGEATTMTNLGIVLWSQGQLAEARTRYAESLEISQEIGDRAGEAASAANLGVLFLSQGRLPDAREHLERCLALMRETGSTRGEAIMLLNLGHARAEESDPTAAEQHLTACLSLSEAINLPLLVTAARVLYGSLRAAAGDDDAARVSLAAACELAVERDFFAQETLARCHLACLGAGDIEHALRVFVQFEERLTAGERREARHALWKATGDRTHLEAAKTLLDAAVADVDEETRSTMLEGLRLNREIMAAWSVDTNASVASGDTGDVSHADDVEPRDSESETRAG